MNVGDWTIEPQVAPEGVNAAALHALARMPLSAFPGRAAQLVRGGGRIHGDRAGLGPDGPYGPRDARELSKDPFAAYYLEESDPADPCVDWE